MMTNQTSNTKHLGSIPTTWQLRTYDVWGNARDGYEVNNTFDSGTVELRIPQTRYNVGVEWHVCHNPECASNGRAVLTHPDVPDLTPDLQTDLCNHCGEACTLESQEFISAAPTDRQIKRAFGVTCHIDTEGDDMSIEVTRTRDGYPIGRMECTSHTSLSPVRKVEVK